MNSVEVVITIKDESIDQMPVIVEKLKSAGMTDIQALSKLGVIIGKVEEAKIPNLRLIEGITFAERSHKRQL